MLTRRIVCAEGEETGYHVSAKSVAVWTNYQSVRYDDFVDEIYEIFDEFLLANYDGYDRSVMGTRYYAILGLS